MKMFKMFSLLLIVSFSNTQIAMDNNQVSESVEATSSAQPNPETATITTTTTNSQEAAPSSSSSADSKESKKECTNCKSCEKPESTGMVAWVLSWFSSSKQ